MTKSQCYYEILGIAETATSDEIKKAYKSQALIWHPDKNQANPDEAHARFQSILKAYETLNDSKERDWYDRHKDQILSGGDHGDTEKFINLFQYFSSACYANIDDSEDGFYTIYRNVFEKIIEEERQAIQNASKFIKGKNRNRSDSIDDSFPTFGSSDSDYEDVVRPFYAFWSGFCTQLTFDHLDTYNTTEAENRRILRLMEKENKKVKDTAKKERNNNVRNLVEFIKKRDKRLKAHKLLVEQQNELNRQKTMEKQRQQRERLSKRTTDYKPSAFLVMDDVEEQLKQLEEEYDDSDLKKGRRGRNRRLNDDDEDQCADDSTGVNETGANQVYLSANGTEKEGDSSRLECECSDESNEDDEEEDSYFCPACNKDFRSIKAFENHESSKKHKQNVQKLTRLLKADESQRWRVVLLALAVALLESQTQVALANQVVAGASASATAAAAPHPTHPVTLAAGNGQPVPEIYDLPLDQLKQKLANLANANPNLFEPEDVRRFLDDEGAAAANRVLNQRQYNIRRAFGLTKSVLKWRKDMGLNRLQASDFPCDLFKLGLIFEQGQAHRQSPGGQYVATNPVIWLRLGALGSIVKHLEKLTPSRLLSYAYNTPRNAIRRANRAVRRRSSRRMARQVDSATSEMNGGAIQPLIKDMSLQSQETVQHVLKAIAWWLNDWVDRNPEEARATLVLDFENTDFAFASWSIGEFLIKLDDLFPDLFDQIIGFRYKPKLWSLHSPISMFNRIFKSRFSSSPETDRKLKFVRTEPQISAYMPRVDAQGYTMLPAHVSGACLGPDDGRAPAGCQANVASAGGVGVYDSAFWSAIHNEFYYSCSAKPRDG